MKLDIYTNKGSKKGSAELSDMVFAAPWNADLVHQVIVSMQSNLRQGSAHTKNRGEVSGGGKKPWQQKGTGRARHGSTRSPIWRHGGVTHGPRSDKNYDRAINKKVKVSALYSVLSSKFKIGKITGLDSLNLDAISTKSVVQSLKGIATVDGLKTVATKNAHNVLFVVPTYSEIIVKSVRNMPQVDVVSADAVNVLDIAQSRYIILVNPEEVNAKLIARHWNSPKIAATSSEKEESKVRKVATKKLSEKRAEKKGVLAKKKAESKAKKIAGKKAAGEQARIKKENAKNTAKETVKEDTKENKKSKPTKTKKA